MIVVYVFRPAHGPFAYIRRARNVNQRCILSFYVWQFLALILMAHQAKSRIGIFGGTFDPVHVGHLIMAEQCREAGQLDQVWFIPSARPPHKQDRPLTPFAQRAEMLALVIAGMPAFRVDDLEKDRPGPSFTAETLEELTRHYPQTDFALLLGSDCLPDLPGWHRPERILELAELLIFARPGWPMVPEKEMRATLHLSEHAPLRLRIIQGPRIDIASRELRQRAAEQRSLRFLVPRAVECYILEKKLYQGGVSDLK
jgi:nicotinate-nucleotide adenylyltransferase